MSEHYEFFIRFNAIESKIILCKKKADILKNGLVAVFFFFNAIRMNRDWCCQSSNGYQITIKVSKNVSYAILKYNGVLYSRSSEVNQ